MGDFDQENTDFQGEPEREGSRESEVRNCLEGIVQKNKNVDYQGVSLLDGILIQAHAARKTDLAEKAVEEIATDPERAQELINIEIIGLCERALGAGTPDVIALANDFRELSAMSSYLDHQVAVVQNLYGNL